MHNIPVLTVQAKTIAEAYEKAILAVYWQGVDMPTQYDKPGDPPSKDCTLNMTIDEPLTDPMIHKCFPGGIADLREYVYELEGLKDNWVKNLNDPKDTRWEYTYSGRMRNYGAWKENNQWTKESVNQIEWAINKLCKSPATRQAQMITWMPKFDTECYDPPCLQSIWLRIIEENGISYLNSNIRFRSNDGFNANHMNVFGFTIFLKNIAQEIANKTKKVVALGRMNWQADSFHIYGKDIELVKKMLISKISAGLPFEKRVLNFHSEEIQEMWKESEKSILEKIAEMNKRM